MWGEPFFNDATGKILSTSSCPASYSSRAAKCPSDAGSRWLNCSLDDKWDGRLERVEK